MYGYHWEKIDFCHYWDLKVKATWKGPIQSHTTTENLKKFDNKAVTKF